MSIWTWSAIILFALVIVMLVLFLWERRENDQTMRWLRGRVEVLPAGVTTHTCWDDHAGTEEDPHVDGTPCEDIAREMVERAAVLALFDEVKP